MEKMISIICFGIYIKYKPHFGVFGLLAQTEDLANVRDYNLPLYFDC